MKTRFMLIIIVLLIGGSLAAAKAYNEINSMIAEIKRSEKLESHITEQCLETNSAEYCKTMCNSFRYATPAKCDSVILNHLMKEGNEKF